MFAMFAPLYTKTKEKAPPVTEQCLGTAALPVCKLRFFQSTWMLVNIPDNGEQTPFPDPGTQQDHTVHFQQKEYGNHDPRLDLLICA